MRLLHYVVEVNPRVLRVVFAIVLAIPMVVVLGLPLKIDQNTRDFRDMVLELGPGDTALVSYDFYVSGLQEMNPQTEQVLHDLFSAGVKVAFVAFAPDGRPLIDQSIGSIQSRFPVEPGVDYVNLGFVAGQEAGIAALLEDIKRVTPSDVRGISLNEMPGFASLTNAGNLGAVITFTTGAPGPAEWVRQMARYTSVPLLVGCNATMFPATQAFLSSGQVSAILNGMVGAAQYELLARRPGSATAQMDVQTVGHVLFLLLIAVGNVAYFSGGRKVA